MITEQRNPRTMHIDQLSTLEMLQLINDEDATVAAAVRQALPQIAQAVDTIVEGMRHGGRLLYIGAGTSGRLGVLDAAECVPTFSADPGIVQGIIAGGERATIHAVDGAEDDAEAGRQAIRERVVADIAQIGIAALVGPEVITGSTRMKAGTAQKMILNMLSTASMIQLGKVYSNLMVDVRVSNQKLAARARRAVSDVTGASDGEAARLLELTGNEVKTAIVVGLLGLAPDEARGRLADAQGMLHRVIGAK